MNSLLFHSLPIALVKAIPFALLSAFIIWTVTRWRPETFLDISRYFSAATFVSGAIICGSGWLDEDDFLLEVGSLLWSVSVWFWQIQSNYEYWGVGQSLTSFAILNMTIFYTLELLWLINAFSGHELFGRWPDRLSLTLASLACLYIGYKTRSLCELPRRDEVFPPLSGARLGRIEGSNRAEVGRQGNDGQQASDF